MDFVNNFCISNNYEKDIIIVTNPVDICTNYLITKLQLAGKRTRVFGSGTIVDTMRLQQLLTSHFNVQEKDITNAYVIGSHEMGHIISWDMIRISNREISYFFLTEEALDSFKIKIEQQLQKYAYEIVRNGAPNVFAISVGVMTMYKAIYTQDIIDVPLSFLCSTFFTHSIAYSLPIIQNCENRSLCPMKNTNYSKFCDELTMTIHKILSEYL